MIQYVLHEFVCAGCAKERRPPTRLPSATPRCFDFNVVIGVDLLFVSGVRDAADLPVINITCLGTLYSTFGLVDVKRRTSSNTWAAFLRLWLRVFGAPQCVMYDEGKEFTGGAFQDGLEMHGIQPVEINRQAPFELGTVERRGGMFKEAFYRTRELLQPQTVEEVEEIIFETSWAIQTLTNRSGYSPAQRVFGKQPSLTLDKLTDGREYHLSPSADAAWEQSNRVRQAARRALMELDSKSRLSRARLARPRRELQQREFQEGEPVLVWRAGRRGATSKVGPCYVILQRGNTVWVSRRGDLWQCNVGQVFPMRASDKDGLEAIPDELLKAKMRLKYDSEKLQYVDVESEMTGESQRPSGGRADAEQPPEPPEVLNPDPSEDLEEMLKDYSPSLPDAEQHPEPAEVPNPDPLIVLDNEEDTQGSSRSSGSSTDRSSKSSGTSSSTSSSSGSSSSGAVPNRAEWPPSGDGTQLRKWVRFDSNARRFRTSNSLGPMWSDVVQRVTIDNATGEVVKKENVTGKELPKQLHKPLPSHVKSVKTVLVYKRVRGHPDPGVDISDAEHPEREGAPHEDARLFDYRVKRSLDEVSGEPAASSAQRSKIFGAWVADVKTEHCDRARHPVIATSRDKVLFKKILEADMVFRESEIYGIFVGLTKKSGKELSEKNFSEEERKMFDGAKVVEIDNLTNQNAIEFVPTKEEADRIRREEGHRIVPSRFVLTKSGNRREVEGQGKVDSFGPPGS